MGMQYVKIASGVLFGALLLVPSKSFAHCDTYSGPVVMAAKQALEKGDVTPVLKWVKKEHEEEIRGAFKKAVAVRGKGAEAKELADAYFFETLVRVHRAGEGEPYTGLKNKPIEPVLAMADKALENGTVDSLSAQIAAHVRQGIKTRFDRALAAKRNAEKSVVAGREFVEAYVKYTHFVEGIHAAGEAANGHHNGASTKPAGAHEH